MGKRIEYIDGMRGLCMWIVVYSHVALWCVGEYAPSCLLNFMRVFFLSGFFFVSGLMAYSGKNEMGGGNELHWEEIHNSFDSYVVVRVVVYADTRHPIASCIAG